MIDYLDRRNLLGVRGHSEFFGKRVPGKDLTRARSFDKDAFGAARRYPDLFKVPP
ncbi:hypothetical protein [Puniceibacterium confluentis]|uniref:hypothetical protein n=1 Tax=Puniceibacterium confluentis TaxID=1958944 RepID=UPI001C94D85A|nr:hypothetical protein [Puniceibacterium confluentis]